MVIELCGHCCSCFLSSSPGKPLRTNQMENACCPPPHSLYIYAYKIMYAAAAKSLQSCPTLCDPIDGSLRGSPIPGILQARTLEWVATSFSNAWKWKVKVKSLSRVRPSATPWTAAFQAPLSMGFSRQEYWSEVPLPSLHPPSTHTQIKSEYLAFSFKLKCQIFVEKFLSTK